MLLILLNSVKFILLILLFLVLGNSFAQNKYPFFHKNKWFYVDSSLTRVSKNTYSFLLPFIGNYAVVKQNDKYGVIDSNENLIISLQYDTIVFNGYPPFYCMKDKKEIWLDINEKSVPIVRGCEVKSSGRSFWTYKKNKKIGLLKFNYPDKTDSLPNIYDELHEYIEGIALVRIDKKWGTITNTGKIITPVSLDSVQIQNNITDSDIHKPIKYYEKNHIGFINTKGLIITKAIYKESYYTAGRFTLVLTEDNNLVYIDSDGRKYYD